MIDSTMGAFVYLMRYEVARLLDTEHIPSDFKNWKFIIVMEKFTFSTRDTR